MTTVIADTNTIWRKKPFEALAKLRSVQMMEPIDWVSAFKRGLPNGRTNHADPHTVLMPPGWASWWNKLSCRRLIRLANADARKRKSQIKQVIVTSPHYWPMVSISKRLNVSLYYYGSDDYRLYDGWGGQQMVDFEAEIVRAAEHSFFVSQNLSDRAISDYGIPQQKTSICPNATSDHFFTRASPEQISQLIADTPGLKRPIVGVVGAINDRLDLGLLNRCLEIESLGSLLFVGQEPKAWQNGLWQRICQHGKTVRVGRQPHVSLPTWMQMLDLALIPYMSSEFNKSCSPMRLYDHLASGKPIVATAACPQVRTVLPAFRVAESDDAFCALVENCLLDPCSAAKDINCQNNGSGVHTWHERATRIDTILKRAESD